MIFVSLLVSILVATPDAPAPAVNKPAPPTRLQLETVEGTMIEGKLKSIDASGVVTLQDVDTEQVSLNDLTSITVATFDSTAASPVENNCTLHLADGGEVAARLIEGGAGRITIDAGLGSMVPVALSGLSGVQFNTVAGGTLLSEFRVRLKDRDKGRDLLIAIKDEKPVVLPGALESLDHESWSFRIGSKVQTGALDRAFGVILGGPAASAPAGPVSLMLSGKRRFSASIRSADATTIDIDAGPLGRLAIPWPQINGIAIRSDRVVYLSDLEPVTIDHRSIYDASWPPKMDRSVTGGPITIAGREFDRGIGIHAPTTLTYDLDGAYDSFVSLIGIDDAAGPRGRAVFKVICDGRVAFESSPIARGPAESVRVPLAGVRKMTLECDPGPDLEISDHCDWAGARLIRAKRAGPR